MGNELVGMATAMAARDTSRKGGDGGDRIDRDDEADSNGDNGRRDVEVVDGSDVCGDCTGVWLTMMMGARGNNTATAQRQRHVASTTTARLRCRHRWQHGASGDGDGTSVCNGQRHGDGMAA